MDIKDEADAQDVVHNEANPNHAAAFDENHPNHGNVRAALDTWFAKAHPERDREIRLQYGDKPIRPEDLEPQKKLSDKEREWDSKIAAWKAEQAQGAGIPEEETPAEIAADGILRSEWGNAYDQNIEACSRALEGIFSTREQLDSYVQRSGMLNDAEMLGDVMRLLAKLGKARR